MRTLDALGRTVLAQVPNLADTAVSYDGNGRLSTVTRGNRTWALQYDNFGRVATVTDPLLRQTSYQYDAANRVVQTILPGGRTISFSWDANGNMTALTPPGHPEHDFQYTPGGADSSVQLGWDGALLTDEAWLGPVAGSVHLGYDNDFRYDPDGLLINVGDQMLTHDPRNGLLTGTALGPITDTYGYNQFGEVASYAAGNLLSFLYTRDDLGRLTNKTETVGDGDSHSFDYHYDAAGHLDQVKQDGAVISTYSYDDNGNRLGWNQVVGTYDSQDRWPGGEWPATRQ
jgi:YD repeat-containing protein